MKFKEQLQALFEERATWHEPETKLEFLSMDIFKFKTYDGRIDELFSKRMLDIIECILNRKTFEYQQAGNYVDYLIPTN